VTYETILISFRLIINAAWTGLQFVGYSVNTIFGDANLGYNQIYGNTAIQGDSIYAGTVKVAHNVSSDFLDTCALSTMRTGLSNGALTSFCGAYTSTIGANVNLNAPQIVIGDTVRISPISCYHSTRQFIHCGAVHSHFCDLLG
jgi:hypothetical protein